MIEREVVRYRPDWIVVVLLHNDFNETFESVQGRYTSSFLKLRISDGDAVEEVPPTPWKPGAADWLRRTAVARYMYYRWQVRAEAIRDLFLRPRRLAPCATKHTSMSMRCWLSCLGSRSRPIMFSPAWLLWLETTERACPCDGRRARGHLFGQHQPSVRLELARCRAGAQARPPVCRSRSRLSCRLERQSQALRIRL